MNDRGDDRRGDVMANENMDETKYEQMWATITHWVALKHALTILEYINEIQETNLCITPTVEVGRMCACLRAHIACYEE